MEMGELVRSIPAIIPKCGGKVVSAFLFQDYLLR
jgi:hypothetical protein